MKIELKQPLAGNSPADTMDVIQVKKALNRLGYYQPFEGVGLNGIPDTAVFDALKSFQDDQRLPATGAAKPGDTTVERLSAAASTLTTGKYIWRTVGDDKVRGSHAVLNRIIRDFSDSPDPGEEFNCRCWAEELNCEEDFITQNLITTNNGQTSPNKWNWLDFVKHYYGRSRIPVSLSEIGLLGDVIEFSKANIHPRVSEQVAIKAIAIGRGPLHYDTKKVYNFGDVSFSIGRATVRSETVGTVTPHGNCLIIDAEVNYDFFDTFTDPADIRQVTKGTRFETTRMSTELFGLAYVIAGKWTTKMSGLIRR